MKFCFRISKSISDDEHPYDLFEGLDNHQLREFLRTIKPGTRMHLVVRVRPGFNIEGKRNYFHGPMLTWICKEGQKMGFPCTRQQMKDEFKKKFLGLDDDGKLRSFADTLEVKVEGDARDPEMKWGEFLDDVRNWCRDVLGSEPPRPDQTDLDEESTTCAINEATE